MFKKFFYLLIINMLFYSCAITEDEGSHFDLSQSEYFVGEKVKITNNSLFDNLKLTLENGKTLKNYYVDNNQEELIINRFLDNLVIDTNSALDKIIL